MIAAEPMPSAAPTPRVFPDTPDAAEPSLLSGDDVQALAEDESASVPCSKWVSLCGGT